MGHIGRESLDSCLQVVCPYRGQDGHIGDHEEEEVYQPDKSTVGRNGVLESGYQFRQDWAKDSNHTKTDV